MYNTLIAGIYFAISAWFGFSGLLSLASHRSGRRSFDYLVLAGTNWLMAVAAGSFGVTLLIVGGDRVGLVRAFWVIGFVSTLATSAGLVHFASAAVEKVRMPRSAWLSYGAALVISVVAVSYQARVPIGSHVSRSVFGLPVRTLGLGLDPFLIVLTMAMPIGVFFAAVMVGRAYLRGKQGTLLVFVAMGLLGLALLNDWLFFSLGRSGVLLTPIAFSLFDFGVAYAFVRRYAIVRDRFSRQRRKLTKRSSELRKSHEALNVVRSELGRKEQLAAVGEMASIIAHEVRNPLAVITNAAASLKKQALKQDDRDVLLSILEEETARLNRLVSDLLSYARPIAPQRRRLLLFELLEQSAVRVDSGGVETVCDENSARGQVWGDPDLLRQVFDNLVVNAIQATGEGGLVTLAVKPASSNGRDGYIVTITDDGEGMDTTIRSRAKDPFFTTRPTGTGLGLAIVGRIVEAHGGELSFDSRAGEGTTVSIFLPLGLDRGVPASQRLRDTLPPIGEAEPSASD